MTTSQDDPVETRIHDLEVEVRQLREQLDFTKRELRDAAEQFSQLFQAHGDLLQAHEALKHRFEQFYPSRRYCPKCRRLVHKDATACACGHTWGPQPDPKAGLPR